MGNLMEYSGITTKIRAMQSRLLKSEDYRELASLGSVTECVGYLKNLPDYAQLFTEGNESDLRRNDLEVLLTNSLYHCFARLYGFSGMKLRSFLNCYYEGYEIRVLKSQLRSIYGKTPLNMAGKTLAGIFGRHASFDMEAVTAAPTLEILAEALRGSVYYNVFQRAQGTLEPNLWDYENQLDHLYFKRMWKAIQKSMDKKEVAFLSKCFGSEMDMLNIQWIYRAKKYYSMEEADIYTMLIPINYRLSTDEMKGLVESESMDAFFQLLGETSYSKLEQPLEDSSRRLLNKMFETAARNNPYSVAMVAAYLYRKEMEIKNIVTAVESVRYNLGPDIYMTHIQNQTKPEVFLSD